MLPWRPVDNFPHLHRASFAFSSAMVKSNSSAAWSSPSFCLCNSSRPLRTVKAKANVATDLRKPVMLGRSNRVIQMPSRLPLSIPNSYSEFLYPSNRGSKMVICQGSFAKSHSTVTLKTLHRIGSHSSSVLSSDVVSPARKTHRGSLSENH